MYILISQSLHHNFQEKYAKPIFGSNRVSKYKKRFYMTLFSIEISSTSGTGRVKPGFKTLCLNPQILKLLLFSVYNP